MKLSEAIRLGAMVRPQAFGVVSLVRRKYFFGLIGPEVRSTCAWGAAAEAAGCPIRLLPVEEQVGQSGVGNLRGGVSNAEMDVPDSWHRVIWLAMGCPECGEVRRVVQMIPHLNDVHHWNRQRIANWVATIEPQDDPKVGHDADVAVEHSTL